MKRLKIYSAGKKNIKAVVKALAVAGIFFLIITGLSHGLSAQNDCKPVTGNASIDAVCCVDASTSLYTNAKGESTHGAYVKCVTQESIKLRVTGDLSGQDAKSIIEEVSI